MSSRVAFLPRDAYPFIRRLQTRWADNDVYGHVNNVVFYAWFDTAVNAYLVEASLLDIEQGAMIGLVVETGCRYARSVRFPESVKVGIRVAHLGTSSVRYELGLFTEGHEAAAAEGHFVHVYVDRGTRRPVPLPKAWRAALAAIQI